MVIFKEILDYLLTFLILYAILNVLIQIYYKD
jgi:hypothetical protein